MTCGYRFLWLLFIYAVISGCTAEQKEKPLFSVLNHNRTGLHFANKLTATQQFNMFHYMYFYNGAGVGAGDFNKDGLIDLFFASNQGKNTLYLNRGNLRFEDVTEQADLPQDGGWSTGVSVVDINADGLLDIYVCKVGNFETLKGKNQLLICTGIEDGLPRYQDQAAAYGLDFSGFSTQAAFFDYDLDGDLDCYLLNHSVHQNGTFAERKVFLGTYHPLTGDRLYRNETISRTPPAPEGEQQRTSPAPVSETINKEKTILSAEAPGRGSPPARLGRTVFVDVTKQSGIHSSAIGYGLGIAVADINLDGYPDLYIGNDFHENDYLYLNQKNGTFTEELTRCTPHTSQFSMGVDVADINNDALPEIISMDMMPYDPYILKRSLGEDEYNIFHMKVAYGYHPQYTKNALQLNRGNGLFSDVAMYSGVYATDWSWAPLWMDFDNDGWKDLFVSNGIPKRLNDIDYVNYVSNDDVQAKINTSTLGQKELSVINNFPQIKLPNKFFRNRGRAAFEDVGALIEGDVPTFSNGSVSADFDNDGDLDVVVNNIDEPVLLYQNHAADPAQSAYLKINLTGPAKNPDAIGAKAVLFTGSEVRTYEKFPVKGFQSSMEVPLLLGLKHTKVDSLLLIWPDNTYQRLGWNKDTNQVTVHYQPGLPLFDYRQLIKRSGSPAAPLLDATAATGLLHRHQENPFVEFDREPLIPFMVSREGPALAVADINGDGLDDAFIGSSKGKKSAVYVQQPSGRFQLMQQPALDKDSLYEEVDAVWVDVNGDRHPDLVVASGGNEYYGRDEKLMPRVYANDGKGHLTRLESAFQNVFLTASCVTPYDFTGDGFVDLFIGGRAVPWEYGQVPQSYLLANDGKGHFKDVTAQYGKELSAAGFVKGAHWSDLDRDGDADLVLALEWDGITAFENNKGNFEKKPLTGKKGWWNFTLPVDVDGDGDLDLIAGNLGLNNRLKASDKEPVKLYYNDFDGNGKKEQVLTYYLQGREIPFANKAELEKQLPVLKKNFLYAEDFAQASLTDVFKKEKLKEASVLTATYFSNAVLINEGNWNFRLQALPWQAQLTAYRDAVVVNANSDGVPDVFLVGNFYDNNIQMGQYDADYGTLLLNRGKGNFAVEPLNGVTLHGQVRHIRNINLGKEPGFILTRNNDSTKIIRFAGLVKQR